MIDKDTLLTYAKLNKLRPWQQEKHYIESMTLMSLSEYPFVFKGGTYLWFFHGLDRFSEDLDFTATGDIPEEIDKSVSEMLKMFGVENSTRIINNDERSFSFRLSAKGPLNTSARDLCHVYVEISKRERLLKEPLAFRLNFDAYKIPIKIIGGMDLQEVASENVRAIVTREKARDAYDLFFLIKKKDVKFDENITSEKLKYYNLQFSNETFFKALKARKGAWKPELKDLIFEKLPPFDEVEDTIRKWISD